MKIEFKITAAEVRELIIEHMKSMMPPARFDPTKVKIMVKSKEAFKTEWVEADFVATYTGDIS